MLAVGARRGVAFSPSPWELRELAAHGLPGEDAADPADRADPA